ncbi:MAG TPA: hypothetical protein EYH56_00940 [Nanoarchaeota archaeon]|nr:hypothetical protein [Nanoarchaeota archaeon]
MIVAFSGSHQVGKTTLVNELKKRFRLPVVNEVAEKIHKLYPEMGYFHKELLMVFEQIREENRVLKNNNTKIIIADRCVWDMLVYSAWLKEKGLITEEEYSIIEAIVETVGKERYSLIFFVRPVIEVNSFRQIDVFDRKAQREIDKMFEKFFRERNINYIEIKEKDLEERVKFVSEVLSKYQLLL